MADYLTVSIGLAAISSLLWVTMPQAFLSLVKDKPREKQWLALSQKTFFIATVWFTLDAVISVQSESTTIIPPSTVAIGVVLAFGVVSMGAALIFSFLLTDSLLGEANEFNALHSTIDLTFLVFFTAVLGVSAIQVWFGVHTFPTLTLLQQIIVVMSVPCIPASFVMLLSYHDRWAGRRFWPSFAICLATLVLWVFGLFVEGIL